MSMKSPKQSIINKYPDAYINQTVDEIRDLLINGFDDSRKTIFLCGKDKSDKKVFDINFQLFSLRRKESLLPTQRIYLKTFLKAKVKIACYPLKPNLQTLLT